MTGWVGVFAIYLHAKADPDRNILWSQIILRKTSGVWKNMALHYSSICPLAPI